MPTGTILNLNKEFLEEEYINKKKSASKIAKDLNCAKKSVLEYLHQYNIQIRGCGGTRTCEDLTGQKFNKLSVIQYLKRNRHNQPTWECKCDCGNIIKTRSDLLKSGHTQSCGCVKQNHPKYRKQYTGLMSGCIWTQIKRTADKRNIRFELEPDYCWCIYLEQQGKCAISGVLINFPKTWKEMKTRHHTASLDRIDSKIHYKQDNIQWIHKDINRFKGASSDEEYIKWCKIVSNYQNNKGVNYA